MNKYSDEVINETRNLISKGEDGLSANIQGLEVWFWGDSLEKVTNEMIEFSLDIVNAYHDNHEKYDDAALKEVKNCIDQDKKIDDAIILRELGTPIIDVATGKGASLLYGEVEEIGNHMLEVTINRGLEVIDVALNG